MASERQREIRRRRQRRTKRQKIRIREMKANAGNVRVERATAKQRKRMHKVTSVEDIPQETTEAPQSEE